LKYQECLYEIANLYLAGDIHSVKMLDKILRIEWRKWQGQKPLAREGWFLEIKSDPVLHCHFPHIQWDLPELVEKVNTVVHAQNSGYPDKAMQFRIDRFKRKNDAFLRF
jgi:hypothetical protein